MRLVVPAALAATVIGLAACNTYAEPAGAANAVATGGRQCFYAPNVTGYRRGLGDTVIVNTNSRDYYQFDTQPYCADRIDWENRIALRSRTGTFICNGYDAEIYVPEAVGAAYCPLYHMHKLTPAEVATVRATPPRDKR
jgi:predicted small secreted protein